MSGDDITTTSLQAWNTRREVVLTVTPEGRVVPGPGMAMDDVAREFLAACNSHTMDLEAEVTRLRASVSHLTELLTGYGDDDYAAVEGGTP